MRAARALASLVLVLAIARVASAAAGGSPVVLPQSGFLLDGQDQPVTTASIAATFRIFRDASASVGETAEWEATCPVAVRAGYYTAQLGDGACAGTSALETSDLEVGRFVETTIGGVTLAPRLQLSLAPVAERAIDADRLGGELPGAYLKKADLSGGYADPVVLSNAANAFAGSGAGLTQVDAAKLGGALPGAYATVASLGAGGGTNVDAARLGSGTIPDGRLGGTYSGAVALSNAANAFTGDGSGLTNVNAATVGGKTLAEIEALQLPATYTGTVKLVHATTCDTNAAGTLRWTGSAVEVCSGTAWIGLGTTGAATCPATTEVKSFTNGDLSVVVPGGCHSVTVKAWGAGGGGGNPGRTETSRGGAGGFATATIAVNPLETLTVVVGGGGAAAATGTGGFGGGGAGHGGSGGGGGGRSAVLRSTTVLLAAAGGGGGGYDYAGAPGGGTTGLRNAGDGGGGYPGTSGAGGSGGGSGGNVGGSGGPGTGGAGTYYGGGGGSGYQGGGGAGTVSGYGNGGGGGSSYHGGGTNGSTTPGSGASAPQTTDTYYVSGVGVGGEQNGAGGHGLVVLTWIP